ncbi:hypothetical protein GGI04_002483 [Coemansia thaxteri]|nr:hypothetical protein GGI04_002483 [Coemansia thaxteri]
MASKLKGLTVRTSSATDISPGEAFVPLNEAFKPGSTRARFEELVSTYRNTHDTQGRALGMLDDAAQQRESLVDLLAMAKNGQLPPTKEIVDLVHKMDFDQMRSHATTFQGKRVIDHFEASTAAGVKAFEEINGEENAQEIIHDLNNMRIKTKDDRKALMKKTKRGTEASKDIASSAGKDFLALASGVGTSSVFRKAISDLSSLVSATVQNKQPKDEDMKPLVDRVRDLVVEVRGDTGVQKSLSSLHSLYTTMYSKSTTAAKDARDKAKGHEAVEDMNDARDHARDLFTRLGNGYDMTAMFAALSAIGVMYRDNESFGELADETREFGRWAMTVDADKLSSDEFETRSRDLLQKGKSSLTEQDSKHFETLSSESKQYMKAVQANPVIVEYKDSMVGLTHSIVGHGMTGEERREHFRALRQDVMANLPALMQAIRYVPLPRVAGQSKALEFAADNIVLDLKRFVPEHISFDSHSEIYPRAAVLQEDKAMRSQQGFRAEQFFYLTITGVNCVAKRVAFYVKKKKGVPRVAEKGLADMIIGGRGMDIVVRLRKLHNSEKPRVPMVEPATSSKAAGKKSALKHKAAEGAAETARMRAERQFDIADVKVKMHSLDIRVHETKHTIGSKLGLMLMVPVAKRLLAKNMAKALADAMVQGDLLLSRHAGAAEDLVIGSSKKVVSSAVGAVKKGANKSKEQLDKIRSKAKSDKNGIDQGVDHQAQDTAEQLADRAKERVASTAEQIKDPRRDSLVEHADSENVAPMETIH